MGRSYETSDSCMRMFTPYDICRYHNHNGPGREKSWLLHAKEQRRKPDSPFSPFIKSLSKSTVVKHAIWIPNIMIEANIYFGYKAGGGGERGFFFQNTIYSIFKWEGPGSLTWILAHVMMFWPLIKEIWAATCDFQQGGNFTSVDVDKPLQPPFKLRN